MEVLKRVKKVIDELLLWVIIFFVFDDVWNNQSECYYALFL